MVQTKICGVKTPDAVAAALEGGAAFIGFNMFPASPRYISPEDAGRLAPPIRGRARIAAVTVDPDDALLDRLMASLRPDLIQLHGRETPTRAAAIAARTGVDVIKALPVAEASDVDAAAPFDAAVAHLMFDAKAPAGAPIPGGNGVAFDWTMLAGRRFSRPWFLAGGLDPWNVGDAISGSGAPIVDVSSGVERGPGIKDPALISAFLEAVRRS